MRLSFWHRWFLLTAALVLLALAAMQWAQLSDFKRGLLGHANALEQARLPELAERLAEEYADAGWRRLQNRPRWLQRLLSPQRVEADQRAMSPQQQNEGRPNPPLGPPPGPSMGARFERGEPLFRRPPPPHPAPFDELRPGRGALGELDFPSRISLLDAEGRLLLGPEPIATAARQPIEYQGRRVGMLVLAPMPMLQGQLDLEFAARQRNRGLLIALFVLSGALILGLLLSRWLTHRLSALADASRRLAAGDFSARVAIGGDDELSALGRDFDHMAEALAANREARDRWIADISHELRTPVTVLRGELAALQDGLRPLDAAAIDSLSAETERLAQRIDDLYGLALSDRGSLSYRFAEVALDALLQECLARHAPAFAAAGVSAHCQPLPACILQRADGARLEQLIDNLLANSARYTERGGRMEVQLQRSRPGWVVLNIDDSAPAPAVDEMAQLGQRSFRASPGARAPEGGGLGLAICRNIAAAHGGRIEFAASSLGGLQVRLTLPLNGAVA